MSLARVKPGQPWRPDAAAHNTFCDAAEYVQRLRSSTSRTPGRDNWQATIIQIKNNSGLALDRFDVLGIAGVFPEPAYNLPEFKNGPILHGIIPAAGDHEGRWAIVLEPAADGDIVAACVAGVCVAKINATDVDHVYAEMADGDQGSLASGNVGTATILWKAAGTGVVWGVVRIGGGSGGGSLWGKLDEELTQGGTATVSVWDGSPLADTGENLEASDWLLSTDDSLDATTKVKVEWISGAWYVTAAECPLPA